MPATSRRSTAAPDHNSRRIAFSERLRDGLWFIPMLMVLGAWALSVALLAYDRSDHRPPFGFHGDVTSAQDLLATVAASTLAMTTLVVSITIVALQLASQQFSPRVMRTFFRDRGPKVALGIFLGTTVYALLILRVVTPKSLREAEFVPAVSVSAAFALMLCSLGAFLYYLHHVAHSIRAVHIMEAVAAETRTAIRALFTSDDQLIAGEWPDRPADLVLASEQGPGSVVTVDEDDLLELAERRRVRIAIVPQVGDYLPSGAPVARIWNDDPAGGPDAVTAADIARLVGVGRERTMRQDVPFGFRQLVDMADKALSPAVNDPTTATQALDRIHDLLRRLAVLPDACGIHRDASGTPRVVVPVPTWDDHIHLACDEIRHHGADSFPVHQRMRQLLEDLHEAVADRPDRRAALDEQLVLLDRAAHRAFQDPEDRRHLGLATADKAGVASA